MNTKILLITNFLLSGLLSNAQTQCPNYSTNESGKPVKIVVYTKLNSCFVLNNESGQVNPQPSRMVTFYMDYGVTTVTLTSGDSINLDKKIMITNTNLKGAVYELAKDDKKNQFTLKSKPFQATTNVDIGEQVRKDMEEMEKRREAEDREWKEKLDRQKAERETQREEEKKAKEAREAQIAEQKKAQAPAETPSQNTNTQPVTGAPKVTASATPSGYPYTFKFYYNGKPIANQKFIVKTDDSKHDVIMQGTTNTAGETVMYTNYNAGTYDVEIFMEHGGVLTKPTSYKLTLADGRTVLTYDYKKLIDFMTEKSGNRSAEEKYYGLDLIK